MLKKECIKSAMAKKYLIRPYQERIVNGRNRALVAPRVSISSEQKPAIKYTKPCVLSGWRAVREPCGAIDANGGRCVALPSFGNAIQRLLGAGFIN